MLSLPDVKLEKDPLTAHTTRAVVFENPQHLSMRQLDLPPPEAGQVQVEVEWSGISTGTEKLLWNGAMPHFPGMGYPLVPGYETVGRIVAAGPGAGNRVGERVFVSGARCFGEVRGLFGGAASRLVVDGDKATPLPHAAGEEATLLALAATAHHALNLPNSTQEPPDLIVGHGVLGRLLARLVMARYNSAPTVWEIDPLRQRGANGYTVIHPDVDERSDYRCAIDVSGDAAILDSLIPKLARHGEIILAGFYSQPLSFVFPQAFLRETVIRVAAEWQGPDLTAVNELVATGSLSLADLITHRAAASDAASAYPAAFTDPACLKMVLDWRTDTC
ncbi:MAG: chlorophyll synthesis pathway protein BchC [Woeseiaceae bacterium]|jgi:bacteriochlorophyllide a dehydrogenase